MSFERPIYLASRSPRRRELLRQIDVRFELLLFRDAPQPDAELSEDPLPGEAAPAYVERIATAKALAGWQRLEQRRLPRAPVLAADTTVVLEGSILGKPRDRDDAVRMLLALSGRRHEVLTGIALRVEDRTDYALSESRVEFRTISEDDARRYVASGEADDKAGSYAIQGRAARFVTWIEGSYSGIMGLPLYETARLLERLDRTHDRRR